MEKKIHARVPYVDSSVESKTVTRKYAVTSINSFLIFPMKPSHQSMANWTKTSTALKQKLTRAARKSSAFMQTQTRQIPITSARLRPPILFNATPTRHIKLLSGLVNDLRLKISPHCSLTKGILTNIFILGGVLNSCLEIKKRQEASTEMEKERTRMSDATYVLYIHHCSALKPHASVATWAVSQKLGYSI